MFSSTQATDCILLTENGKYSAVYSYHMRNKWLNAEHFHRVRRRSPSVRHIGILESCSAVYRYPISSPCLCVHEMRCWRLVVGIGTIAYIYEYVGRKLQYRYSACDHTVIQRRRHYASVHSTYIYRFHFSNNNT